MRGLGLRITAGGAKSFIFDYRADGVKRRATLGRVSALSLEKARESALAYRQEAKEGRDPLEEERVRRALPTVAEALDRFETEYIPRRIALGRMAESTATEYRRQIARHLRPALGRKRVRDVTPRDLENMLAKAPADTRQITRGKAPKGQPMPPVSANRLLALCSNSARSCSGCARIGAGGRNTPTPPAGSRRRGRKRGTAL